MLRLLIKVRAQSMLDSMFKNSFQKKKKNSSAGMKILFTLLFLYAGICFLFIFGMLFSQMCKPFVDGGLGWFYFSTAAMVAFALCFIGSIFMTQSQLFDAKDNELLLSMPIKPSEILGSRIIFLYISNIFYEALVMGPAGVVYLMSYEAEAAGIIIFILVILLLPLLSLALACIVGWLVAVITSRMRNKTIFTMILSIGFLAAYFYFYAQINTYITTIIQKGAEISASVKRAVPPVYYLGSSIISVDFIELLIFAACCILPFIILYFILSKSFIKIATSKRGAAKIQYKEKAMGVRSVKDALLNKELKRFFTCPAYMMNAGIGSVMSLIAIIALIIKRDDILSFFINLDPSLKDAASIFVVPVLCFMSAMNTISASSISLEGKSMWIITAAPVRGRDVLIAKVKSHLIISLPFTILLSLAAIIFLKPDIVTAIFTILCPVTFSVFNALIGLLMNLSFPRLNWISEMMAVKQGVSVIATMGIGMVSVLTLSLLYALLLYQFVTIQVFILIATVIMLLINLLMLKYIAGKGGYTFEKKFCI